MEQRGDVRKGPQTRGWQTRLVNENRPCGWFSEYGYHKSGQWELVVAGFEEKAREHGAVASEIMPIAKRHITGDCDTTCQLDVSRRFHWIA